MFQSLKHMFHCLEYIFHTLEYMFQTLKQNFYHREKTFIALSCNNLSTVFQLCCNNVFPRPYKPPIFRSILNKQQGYERNPKLGQDSNSRVLRQSFSRPFQFAKFVRRDSVIFPENSMEMLYRFKSHLEGNLFTCQIFREKDFFAACQFQLQKIMSW